MIVIFRKDNHYSTLSLYIRRNENILYLVDVNLLNVQQSTQALGVHYDASKPSSNNVAIKNTLWAQIQTN